MADDLSPSAQPDGAQSAGSDQVQSPASEQSREAPRNEQTPPEGERQARQESGEPEKKGDDGEARERKRSRRDARIDNLTRDLNHYRRESEHYRRLYESSSKKPRKPLDRMSFKTEDEFLAATAERAVETTSNTFTKTQADTAAQRARDAQVQLFNEREDEFAERVPDYRDVAYSKDIEYSRPMLEAVSTSESGPALAYYFGKNPREASRIAHLPPLDAAREIGRLEMKIQSAEKKAPKAPPPVQTVKPGGVGAGFRPDSNDPEAYRKWRNGKS